MLYFPQLGTGALSQYPVRKSRRTRTASSRGANGDLIKLSDPDAETVEWELRLTGLTDEEWEAIEALFDQCEGGLRTFCFLDPLDNLLSYSEDFAAAVWQRDPLLQITAGAPDPAGGTSAARLVNVGQTPQSLSQRLDVPAALHYCFSLYVRGAASGGITLEQRSATRALAQAAGVYATWRRVRLSGKLETDEQGVTFSVILPPGASVEIYGAQVEAQPAHSEYRRTSGRGGVYPEARFVDDELRLSSSGPNCHDTILRIISPLKSA